MRSWDGLGKELQSDSEGGSSMVVHEAQANMASVVAVQVHSWLGAVEAHTSKGSIVNRFTRTMSTEDGGKRRIVQHVLLETVWNANGVFLLVQVCFLLESQLLCTLGRSAPPHRSDRTYAAGANATGLLPNVVVAATCGTLHFDNAVNQVV